MATYNFSTSTVETKEGQRSLLTKSFLYMAGFLLITTAVSLILSFTLQKAGLNTDAGYAGLPQDIRTAYYGMMIGASIMQIILIIWITFGSLKQSKTNIIPMILYSLCMGVLISSFALFLKWWTIASAFGIAALAFGGMALIGMFSKNASGLGMVGYGLIFSVMMCTLFNLLFALLMPGIWGITNIITSAIIVVAIMCITAYDVYQIRVISQAGYNASNLAMYFAFNLYLDFIVILLHILRFLAIFASNNDR